MLALTSVSDLISIVTSIATNIDVHATWIDFQSATGVESYLPGRTNTLITTATTTTVIGSPADATTYRTIKNLIIRNRGTVSNAITVKLTDGVNNVELVKVVLAPGAELHFDGSSWRVISAEGGIVTAASVNLSTAKIDFATSGDSTVISGAGSTVIKVFRLFLVVAAATNIAFKDSATALSGAVPLITAGASITMTDEGVPHFTCSAGNGFVINSSNAVQVSGSVWFTQA